MGDQSAYSVLGLGADADDAAIERAYRRLIKQFHPDRGGDAVRATEINQAYDQLRSGRNLRDPLDFNDADLERSGEIGAWVMLALVLAAASVFLVVQSAPRLNPSSNPEAGRAKPAIKDRSGPMDRPMSFAEIDRAAVEAQQLKRTSDELGLAVHSRTCHQALRIHPTLSQFDRCAAFDAAVVQLQDRDPLRDQGPFSELAVTGRTRSAAALLSDDSVAVDARLDRIRQQVERELRPASGS